MKWRQIETRSEEETAGLGRQLADLLSPGMVVALYGDLGAGKTALTRGVARGLGITEPVTSPTFTVVQEYPCPRGQWLFHLDMYRIDNEEAALAFGIEEYLYAADGITLVEWPERIEGLLRHAPGDPGEEKNLLVARLTHAGRNRREICLPTPIYDRLMSAQGSENRNPPALEPVDAPSPRRDAAQHRPDQAEPEGDSR